MGSTKRGFDGPLGRVVGRIMAIRNADAEFEAVARSALAPDAHVLVLGFGPGVGIVEVLRDAPHRRVTAVDPSEAMHRTARRRVTEQLGRASAVMWHLGTADSIPVADACVDGAIAVNALQLCEPLEATFVELARVLGPGASLVSITHPWAIERSTGLTPGEWIERASTIVRESGFVGPERFASRADDGTAVGFRVRRRAP
ncbi:MAG: class I SAM-dependent methyltransferase [Actinomycetota bacterium]